jgi:mono/diheme cytochrome c family protein
MPQWRHVILLALLVPGLNIGARVVALDGTGNKKFYHIVDGRIDARTYNGFKRYHAGCNHCHGPDAMGSSVAPSLLERLPQIEPFREIVRNGVNKGTAAMLGFSGDANVSPYVDDIYAYLQARADGALGRGRPRLER